VTTQINELQDASIRWMFSKLIKFVISKEITKKKQKKPKWKVFQSEIIE
jgi:hypothetical protein